MGTKTCTRCGVEKDLTEWHMKYGKPEGGCCRVCHNEKRSAYAKARRIAMRLALGGKPKAKSWKTGNRAWERYCEALNRSGRQGFQPWYTNLVVATPKWLSPEHWVKMGAVYAQARAEKATVDHCIPLVGKDADGNHVVSGLHVPWNLQVLSQRANSLKGQSFACEEES